MLFYIVLYYHSTENPNQLYEFKYCGVI